MTSGNHPTRGHRGEGRRLSCRRHDARAGALGCIERVDGFKFTPTKELFPIFALAALDLTKPAPLIPVRGCPARW